MSHVAKALTSPNLVSTIWGPQPFLNQAGVPKLSKPCWNFHVCAPALLGKLTGFASPNSGTRGELSKSYLAHAAVRASLRPMLGAISWHVHPPKRRHDGILQVITCHLPCATVQIPSILPTLNKMVAGPACNHLMFGRRHVCACLGGAKYLTHRSQPFAEST